MPMSTRAMLERALRRRVPNIDAVEVNSGNRYEVEVRVRPKEGVTFDEVTADIYTVLNDEAAANVTFKVVPYDDSRRPGISTETPPLAGFVSNQTLVGIKETLVKAVPSLGRAVFEVRPGQGVRVLVAEEDGSSSTALVERVRKVLSEITYVGLPHAVEQLPADVSKNDLANAGFPLPRRDTEIVKLTEEDEDVFARRIRKLLNGEAEPVRVVDGAKGARLVATPTFTPPLPLPCLLAFYDRVFVEMPVAMRGDEGDYFIRNFGSSKDDFIVYCAQERVIPIFKFNLGNYPREAVSPWIENFGLPWLTPRAFDYVTLRHVWNVSPYLRVLREDPSLAKVIRDQIRRLKVEPDAETPGFENLLSWLLIGAESFEGVAWHRGHLALMSLSSGGPITHVMSAVADMFPDKAAGQTVAIETSGVVRSIATAQAFDASLSEGMLLNDFVLQLVLPYFKGANEARTSARTAKLATLIESLDLHYSGRIPAKEYLDILDLAETRRIRTLAHKLLGEGTDRDASLEIRERVQALNAEIRKIEGNAVDTAGVDVVGTLAKGGSSALAPAGGTFGLNVLVELLVNMVSRVGSKIGEKWVDDTKAGDFVDKVRGAVNGVSPHAVRVYRLRKKLSK